LAIVSTIGIPTSLPSDPGSTVDPKLQAARVGRQAIDGALRVEDGVDASDGLRRRRRDRRGLVPATCVGGDPQAWPADVLARIADTPTARLQEVLPWRWRDRRNLVDAA